MQPDDFQSFPFITRNMFAFQHGASFKLDIHHYSNNTKEIEIIGFTKEGPFRFVRTHTGDLARETETFSLPDVPIWISVRNKNESDLRGDHYIQLFLKINDDEHFLFGEGYVSHLESISWPSVAKGNNTDGRGLIRSFGGTNPAANTEISETVPTNTSWKLKSFMADLVTDSNAATRKIRLIITDGTNDLMEIAVNGTQIESLTRTYSFVEAGRAESSSAGSTKMGILPSDLLLPEGFIIKTQTDSIQAGDNWTAPRLLVEQFITP